MKKLFMALPAFALVMAMTSSASALMFHWMPANDELNVSSSNNAWVTNDTSATSDTGSNTTIFNKGMLSGNIVTGDAGAGANSSLGVNSNITAVSAPCDCYGDVTVESKNHAFVVNTTSAGASTGGNKTIGNGGYFFGGGSGNITTGGALSGATSFTLVNSNVTSLP